MKKILAGLALLVLFVPAITFAQTGPMTPAYRASLEQLLQLLEQELATLLAAQTSAPTTTPAVAATPSTATTTLSIIFTPEPPQESTRDGVMYEHVSPIQMAITASGSNPVYIPLTSGSSASTALAYYTYPATVSANVAATFTCGNGGLLITSGQTQFCMIEPNTTGDVEASFEYNQAATSTIQYQIGISSVNYTNNPANTTLSQYLPQTKVLTSLTDSQ